MLGQSLDFFLAHHSSRSTAGHVVMAGPLCGLRISEKKKMSRQPRKQNPWKKPRFVTASRVFILLRSPREQVDSVLFFKNTYPSHVFGRRLQFAATGKM